MKNGKKNKDNTLNELGKQSREISQIEKSEKLVVEKLKRSEEKYLDLFENANDAICILDSDLKFKEVNKKTLKMFGYTKEELLNMNAFDIIPPGQIPRFELEFNKLQEKGSYDIFVGKARTKDGRLIDIEVSSSVIKEGDKIIGTRDIIRDITERVQNQEALRESEERYRNIIEYSNDMIWTLDTEGRFLFFNKVSEEITGFKLEDWRGKSFVPLIKKEELPKIIEVFHKTLSGKPQHYEVTVKKVDGSKLILLVNTAPIYSKGEVIGTVSCGRDITERKETEEQIKESLRQELEKSYEKLRESEEMYRNLFENANDAILTCDAEGHITTANNAAVRLSGSNTKDELIGTHYSDWLTPETLRQALNNTRKYFSGEDVKQPTVHEFIRKNGEHRWVEIRGRILKVGDKAKALHCIARDITERIKLEQELKESEAKYRELFENSLDAMYVVDIEGNILKMNQAGLRILSCSKEEVIGNNISKWLTPKSLKIVENRLEKWHSGEIVTQTDILELVCRNREHRWIEIKTRYIKEDDSTIEIHGVAKDITENIILKQELKKSNKHRKLLCYLIEGTVGGKTRALILKHLSNKSYNANQLATALNMDYKTIRHHLKVLVKSGIITEGQDEYPGLYFIAKNVESDLDEMLI
ncbi:MAG TPA: PAS domain S-box protein [Ignavibacteriaceae bacterium]